jgi:predicted phosphohydrolase
MKIYAISDLHLSGENVTKPMDIFRSYSTGYIEEVTKNWNASVGEGDVVLISGDISWAMYLKDAQGDLDFIGKQKGIKIMIRGNHDYWWKSISSVRAALYDGVFALQNDSIRLDGVVICGTRGWTVPEPSDEPSTEDIKLYNREIGRLRMSLKSAAAKRQDGDVLIVMMHYPPVNSTLEDSSFTALFSEYTVNKVVYGHLHGQHIQTPIYYKKDGIEYYLTSCDKVNNTLVRIL